MTDGSASTLEIPAGGRLAVIGDIGGHVDALREELSRLGVADDGGGIIPADLRIVQVGDLIHRGPASEAVVELVDTHLRRQPRRWTQIVGNHEAHYLRRRQFSWPEKLDPAAVALLREWWRRGVLQAAVAFRAAGEEFVVTHAGVTRGFWEEVLGSPPGAFATARAVNAMAGLDDRRLFRAGTLISGLPPDPLAGPVWAAAGQELVAHWLDVPLPFSQIHGHTTVFDWDSGRWYVDGVARERTVADEATKHVTVSLDGGRLIGVDPGHSAQARGGWRAWEVDG